MSTHDDGDATNAWGFSTKAIHVGQDPEPMTGAVTVPVFQTSTFAQEAVGKHSGYEYARTGNPTRTALQKALAALEGAAYGVSFASGLAAEDTILRLLEPGDHVVMGNDAYGGTFRLISKVFGKAGITWSAEDLTDPSRLDQNWPDNTKMVWRRYCGPVWKVIPDTKRRRSRCQGSVAWSASVSVIVTPPCGSPKVLNCSPSPSPSVRWSR